MAEAPRCSFRSSQTLALIESSPLSSTAWEALAERVRTEDNAMSSRSLEVVIAGLKKIEEASEGRRPEDSLAARVSNFSQAMFVRLANAYNSPTLLKEVGLIYLRDLGLPNVALKHFERALLLGGPEKELRPLTEAAAVAQQRQIARQSGGAPALSGLTTAVKMSPAATTIIRRTGRMLLPARFGEAGLTPPEKDEATPPQLSKDLPHTPAECLEAARKEIKAGALARAETLLQKSSQDPDKPAVVAEAWTELGHAAFEAVDYARVERAFSAARTLAPQSLAAHFNAALGFQLIGNNEEAVQAYAEANRLHDRHPKILCNLGVLYFQMEAYAEAAKVLEIAVEVDPNYARAWDNLAGALGAQDKLEEALEAADRAVALKPDYAEAHFKIGLIHFAEQDWEKAEVDLKRAAAAPSLRGDCDLLLALIYCQQDKMGEGEAAVRRAAAAESKSEWLWMAWNDLGLFRLSENDLGRAAFAFEESRKESPDEPSVWINLGVTQHRSGEKEAARRSFQRVVELNPLLADGWHNLGTICAELGDFSGAVTAFQREAREAPGNVRAWHDLGVALERLGRGDEARQAFARAETSAPEDKTSSVPETISPS